MVIINISQKKELALYELYHKNLQKLRRLKERFVLIYK